MTWSPQEGGQSMVEYALIIVLIALVVVALIAVFGEQVSNLYSTITTQWPP
jgi:pilus assembly protein Flp/PilA